ncbi:hypothetical protein [Actinoallomurus sp. CA-150999]|uniref:hypothetical protein n=1 Tax=Actinoallomurus sp. CA-150999 TaxID=3239887 RepID=UPI003D90C320
MKMVGMGWPSPRARPTSPRRSGPAEPPAWAWSSRSSPTDLPVALDGLVDRARQAGLSIVDATVVRGLLVPATMRLLGARAWWAPRPLARW